MRKGGEHANTLNKPVPSINVCMCLLEIRPVKTTSVKHLATAAELLNNLELPYSGALSMALLSPRYRYVLVVVMSTVAERQKLSLEFVSVASAAGYFSIRVGSMDKTAAIPYDAVSKEIHTSINDTRGH